jgi:hypothetical protein
LIAADSNRIALPQRIVELCVPSLDPGDDVPRRVREKVVLWQKENWEVENVLAFVELVTGSSELKKTDRRDWDLPLSSQRARHDLGRALGRIATRDADCDWGIVEGSCL